MITALIVTSTKRAKTPDGFEMSETVRNENLSRSLTILLASLLLTGCASFFDPKPDHSPDPYEDETSRMERYVDCLRDKDREVEDPPCLLK